VKHTTYVSDTSHSEICKSNLRR